MPPVPPPADFPTQAAIGVVRDAQGREVGKVYLTTEFSQWLQAVLRSLKSAT